MVLEVRPKIGLAIGQLTYGGAESQLYELARGLVERCDPFVYCLSEKQDPYGPRLAELGVPVRVFPARGPLDLSRVMKLASWLRRDEVSLVHAFLFNASAYAYLATRMNRDVALITSARNCKLEPSAIRHSVMSRAFGASDAVICNSTEMAEFASRHYEAPADRMHIVYNGVDTKRFAGAASDDGATSTGADRVVRIGTIGRLERQKNYRLFLDAARILLDRGMDARFEIVGEGSLSGELRQYARSRNLNGNVSFSGTRRDVPAFLGGLDQFWLTSDWEGTPNVVLEAMAAGVPVVATRVGGTPEIVEHEKTGLVVDSGSLESFSSAALRLIEDRALAERLSAAASKAVREKFSVDAMVDATWEIYDAIQKQRSDSESAR